MIHRLFAVTSLAALVAAATPAWAAPQTVTNEDIANPGSEPTYVYNLGASDMTRLIDTGGLKSEVVRLHNATLRSHRNVYFVSADAGEREAELVYCFDFSGVSYRPTSVSWRDRLTLFTRNQGAGIAIETAWSTDGENFQTIQQAQSAKGGETVDLGELMPGEPVALPARPEKVYYRVRFTPLGNNAQFVGDTAQWNRTGNNAPLFRAEFALKPLTRDTQSPGIEARTTYPVTVPHITDGKAYPQDVMAVDTAERWKFLGAVRGHSGGVETVDAPGRPGERAILCHVTVNNDNPDAPRWLAWQRELKPQLNIKGIDSVAMDIYPLDHPIEFPLMVQLGHHRGFGIIPATWRPVGELEPGKWHTVRIPIKQNRPDVDAFRLTFNTLKPGIPMKRPVRFVLDNIRFEPAPADPVANRSIDTLTTAGPVSVGYLQQTTPAEISEGDHFGLSLELQADSVVEGKLRLRGQNQQTGQSRVWTVPVSLRPPFTNIRVHVDAPMKALGFGPQRYRVAVLNNAGQEVAASSQPVPVEAYSRVAMNQRRHKLLDQTTSLLQRADELQAGGTVVDEPRVTLTVGEMFLRDGGLVEYDFDGQKEQAIAIKLMDDLEVLLERAASDLDDREAGRVREQKVDDYTIGEPLRIGDGRVWQGDHPVFFIGPLNGTDMFHRFPALGFNSTSIETRIKDWYNDMEGPRDPEFVKKFFDDSQRNGLASNLLLSSHYPPAPMPEAFAAGHSEHTGVGMFPWDVLAPETEAIFEDWYGKMLPMLREQDNLVSLGTANEPGYTVSRQSQTFAKAFGPWAEQEYGSIADANERWGTRYASFDAIDLPSFFERREQSPAAEYDWQRFVDEPVAAFFQRRKEALNSQVPGVPVWTKLMGHEVHFGYHQLNEHSSFATGQNVLGTDSSDPMWLDYLKSINPDWPVYDTEWHFMAGVDPNNQQILSKRIYSGVLHGVQAGLIWTWNRKDWRSEERRVGK